MAIIACQMVRLPVCLCVYLQRVCQRERACGEQERVPEAQETAADWTRAQWLPGVDLQSWYGSSLFISQHAKVVCDWQTRSSTFNPVELQGLVAGDLAAPNGRNAPCRPISAADWPPRYRSILVFIQDYFSPPLEARWSLHSAINISRKKQQFELSKGLFPDMMALVWQNLR